MQHPFPIASPVNMAHAGSPNGGAPHGSTPESALLMERMHQLEQQARSTPLSPTMMPGQLLEQMPGQLPSHLSSQTPPPPPPMPPNVPYPAPLPGQPPQQDPKDQRILELQAALAAKDKQLRTMLISNVILNSSFLKEKTVLPPSIALEIFGRIFQVATVDGALQAVAHGPNGEPIMSRKDPSWPASPEEALEIYILEFYPERDAILRANQGGAGASGNHARKGFAPQRINRTDAKAFAANLEGIAKGEVDVR